MKVRKQGKPLTESELLMLHVELLNNAWAVLFTWIGTTTAMIGAAYFAAGRIRISLVIAMLGLYSIFTAACFAQIFRTWGRIQGVGEDLALKQERGAELTRSAQILLTNLDSQLVAGGVQLLMFVVFLGSVIYVIYCFKGGGAK